MAIDRKILKASTPIVEVTFTVLNVSEDPSIIGDLVFELSLKSKAGTFITGTIIPTTTENVDASFEVINSALKIINDSELDRKIRLHAISAVFKVITEYYDVQFPSK